MLLPVGKIAIIRFDYLVIPAFLEFFYPTRFIIFSTSTRLLVPICDSSLFNDICEKEGELIMNPIVLIVIVIIDGYVGKIVLNLGSGT